MTPLINIPEGTKAANRKDAYAIARGIAAGGTILESEKLALLLHFAPSAPAKAKTAEQWLARFVANDKDVRSFLRYLHSDGTHMRATDGHILGWAPTDKPAGYYHPKTGDPVECSFVYPDINRVIPTRNRDSVVVDPLTVQVIDRDLHGKSSPLVKIGPAHFQKILLDKVANGGPVTMLVGATPNDSARGKGPLGEFVIMPTRV
jgi:hypothetical protein